MVSKEKEPGMILTRLTGAALEDAIIFKYHHPSIKNISKYQQISKNPNYQKDEKIYKDPSSGQACFCFGGVAMFTLLVLP